jgi:aryl-alcohol dehydrogenase-like predicted oxidoreductase
MGGGSRRWVMRAVEDSLRRLDTDWIDVYQLHGADRRTDIDETLGALSDLVRAGKVRSIGVSNFAPEQIVEAMWCSERRGHMRFRTQQPPYSILNRAEESLALPIAQQYGMGVLTWGPLSSGWLSGRALADSRRGIAFERARFDTSIPENALKVEAVAALSALASEAGMSLPHLALAFVRAHPAVTSAIIGPRTMEQLDDCLAGVDTTLDDGILDRIDEIVPPGVDLNSADRYRPPHPAVADKRLRRR